MAIIRKTVVDQIEVTRNGGYQIRLAILIDEDGDEDIDSRKWHRTMVWNSGQVDATFAGVNAALAQMKAAPVPQAAINRVRNVIIAVEGVIGVQQPPDPPVLP